MKYAKKLKLKNIKKIKNFLDQFLLNQKMNHKILFKKIYRIIKKNKNKNLIQIIMNKTNKKSLNFIIKSKNL